jgi:anti-sigma B factor antagonist
VVERQLTVTVEFATCTNDVWPVVTVSGEVDVETSPVLEERLTSVLDRGLSSIRIDLADVTFLDSTGLSVLISGLKRCRAAGGELRLLSPRPNVRKVLEITGLTDVFQVSD